MIVEGSFLDVALNLITFPLQLIEFIVQSGLGVLFFDIFKVGS
jgi:hypothetical protein